MKTVIIAFLTGLLIACNHSTPKNKSEDRELIPVDSIRTGQSELTEQKQDTDYLLVIGDSVEIPSFEIGIVLSEKAEAKLRNDNESVIVRAFFTGDPIENIPDEYKDKVELNELILLSFPIELTDKRIAKFENLKFQKGLYDLLKDKDIHLLINVYSGRKSTDLNLLSCEILQDNMSKIQGKRFTLKGKLIYND